MQTYKSKEKKESKRTKESKESKERKDRQTGQNAQSVDNKKRGRAACQTMSVYFSANKNYMQPNDMTSALCACKDGKHTDTIFGRRAACLNNRFNARICHDGTMDRARK